MRINDRRLARMIARDPVPVAYTIKETDISVSEKHMRKQT